MPAMIFVECGLWCAKTIAGMARSYGDVRSAGSRLTPPPVEQIEEQRHAEQGGDDTHG